MHTRLLHMIQSTIPVGQLGGRCNDSFYLSSSTVQPSVCGGQNVVCNTSRYYTKEDSPDTAAYSRLLADPSTPDPVVVRGPPLARFIYPWTALGCNVRTALYLLPYSLSSACIL